MAQHINNPSKKSIKFAYEPDQQSRQALDNLSVKALKKAVKADVKLLKKHKINSKD